MSFLRIRSNWLAGVCPSRGGVDGCDAIRVGWATWATRSGDPLSFSKIVKMHHMLTRLGLEAWGLFLESPETFRAYSGDIILFVSSKRRRFEARNFAVIFMFIAFTTY